MSLKDIWTEQEAYTTAASDRARQLAFAGIAVIWVFKPETGGVSLFDRTLVLAATFFVLALSFDFLQYILGAGVFWILGNRREALSGHARDKDYSGAILRPMDVCFFLKIGAIFAGYVALFLYLSSKLI